MLPTQLAPYSRNHSEPELPSERLTTREQEVLVLLAQGYTNPEIAARLCIAVSTVKVHIRNVYAKLHARNRIAAINAAYHLHLLERGG